MEFQNETLRPLIDPKSIAIIGASGDLNKIGGIPIRALLKFNYEGKIIPINPKYDKIADLPCYAHISEAPGEIDLALVIVPGSRVLETVRECGERGVRSIIIVSAGFAEFNDEGKALQDEVVRTAKQYNMRILGPNTAGMINYLTGASANFGIEESLGEPIKGNISIASQSGAFNAYILGLAIENEVGLNCFLGTGNQADVDVADCVAYFAEDPNTKVIGCYIEGMKDTDKLEKAFELARRHKKQVIAIKVGRTERGRRAMLPHTGSIAGSDEEYEAIFKRTGVYRAESVQEFLDVAKACSLGLIPKGNKVAVFSVSGAMGVVLAEQLTEIGLPLPEPDEAVQKQLLELVPFASAINPIDFTGQLVNETTLVGDFMKTVLDNGDYDIALISLVDIGAKERIFKDVLKSMEEVRQAHPDVVQLMHAFCIPETRKLVKEIGVAEYNDPTRLVKVTKALAQIGETYHAVEKV